MAAIAAPLADFSQARIAQGLMPVSSRGQRNAKAEAQIRRAY